MEQLAFPPAKWAARISADTSAPRKSVTALDGAEADVLRKRLPKGKPSPAVQSALADLEAEGHVGHGNVVHWAKRATALGLEGEAGARGLLDRVVDRAMDYGAYPEATVLGDVRKGMAAAAKDDKRKRASVIKKSATPSPAGELSQADDYVDVAAVLGGDLVPPTPSVGGIRADGRRLLYASAVNGLVGEPEQGKTLIATAMVADELHHGGSALHVDADHNGVAATLSRYRGFGVPLEVLVDRSRFRLVVPEDRRTVERVVEQAAEWSPSVSVLDSVGELLPMFGGDSNSADDISTFHRAVPAALAATGSAVLQLDHVAKTATSTGYASGSGAKKRVMDGAYYAVRAIEAFRPGVGGAAALNVLKDRHGGVRAFSADGREPCAAVFRLDSRGGSSTWEFHPAAAADEQAEERLEADVAVVLALDPFPTSKEKVIDGVARAVGEKWGNSRAFAALREARERRTTTIQKQSSGLIQDSSGLRSKSVPRVPVPIDGDRGLRTGEHK